MNAYYQAVKQSAANWILKTLSSKKDWRAQNGPTTNYYYIPLIELARTSRKYDLRTLKDASYLLKDNAQIEIFGDDFEPYGMLIKILDAGLEVQKQSIDFQNRVGKWLKNRILPLIAIGIFSWVLFAGEKSFSHNNAHHQVISVIP